MINKDHVFFQLSQDVDAISAPLNTYFQIHYFAFKRTYDDGSKIYLFNHPTYYRHWFKSQYYLIGNREAKPSHYESGYDLWESLPDPYKLYDEGAKNFDIANGLTVTRKYEKYCDFFFFATNSRNTHIRQLYFERRDVFEKYCDYFVSSSQDLINRAETAKIILPSPKPIELPKPVFEINKFLKEIHSAGDEGLCHLTVREIECAYLLAEGKSYKEIAKVFGLSPRTIEEHSHNIRHKLGCKNKSELISVLSKKIGKEF